jgi:hypothetical protein
VDDHGETFGCIVALIILAILVAVAVVAVFSPETVRETTSWQRPSSPQTLVSFPPGKQQRVWSWPVVMSI